MKLIVYVLAFVFLIPGCSSESKPEDEEEIVETPIELRIEILDQIILTNEATTMKFDSKGINNESQISCESSNSQIIKIEGKNIVGLKSGTTSIVCKYNNVSSNSVSISIEDPVVEEPAKKNISLISITSPVKAGANATLKIKGLANTEYSIYVYYSSGISEASGLQDKTSGADGKVNWTWKVGSRTSTGTYQVVVTDGDESFEIQFIVK